MKDKIILIMCGILLFGILIWNIIEEQYQFNSTKEIYLNQFPEGYQKIGELTLIDEWAIWDTSKSCWDTIYNNGEGLNVGNMTYEQEFCVKVVSQELTQKLKELETKK